MICGKKRSAVALLVGLALAMSGCRGWRTGSYSSVTPHQERQMQISSQAPRVSTLLELRGAVRQMVDNRTESGAIILENFSEEHVESDMLQVMDYIRNTYPMGAYAVEELSYTRGTSGNQPALAVTIRYGKTRQEMENVQMVSGMSGAQNAVAKALESCVDSVVFQLTGYTELDFTQFVKDYAEEHPDVVMEMPKVTVQIYPATGDARLVEMGFSYEHKREDLRSWQAQVGGVYTAAALYVNNETEDAWKFEQLYTFLMERFDYTLETSMTPSYSLLLGGKGDSKAFALTYAAMCRRVGLNCDTVLGTRNGQTWYWNIIMIDDTYYYVDLLRCVEEDGFRQMVDGDMGGYVWDTSAYPECGVKQDTSYKRQLQGLTQ